MNRESRFRDFLSTKGLKYTPERGIILSAILSIKGHFLVEDLYAHIRQSEQGISLATVYRTIPLLLEGGVVREVPSPQGKVAYEQILGNEHHDHLLCTSCGKVIDFKDDLIEKRQDAVCDSHGFEPQGHQMVIKGYCRACASKNK
ncbi:MAG: Fur family transcriptional regulator [Nitrospinota bacterium]